jgi:plasmid maintenance system antidote protein VapI
MATTPIIIDRERIKSMGLSVYGVAQQSKIHPTAFYRITDGETAPSIAVARRIARVLGWPLDHIRFPKEL